MRLVNFTDVDDFFKAVDSCSGLVELVTEEGDRLNLKSRLSQYVLANLFSGSMERPKMELMTSEPGDMERMKEFVE